MLKIIYFLFFLFTISTFSQNGTNSVYIDSSNIESFFEDFCEIAIKDEFEKSKDYKERIRSLNEQKLGSGLYLFFEKEIIYDPNYFNYDAEFERYFMAQHAANISMHNDYSTFLDSDNIVVALFSKEILMNLEQKKMGLFGAYKNYVIASNVDYDEYSNFNGDELASRIYIYMPIDEAKAFKRMKSKIAMKIKMKIVSYSDCKITRTSEFFPNTKDKMTDHISFIIKGDIEKIMFYDLNTSKIYTSYMHQIED